MLQYIKAKKTSDIKQHIQTLMSQNQQISKNEANELRFLIELNIPSSFEVFKTLNIQNKHLNNFKLSPFITKAIQYYCQIETQPPEAHHKDASANDKLIQQFLSSNRAPSASLPQSPKVADILNSKNSYQIFLLLFKSFCDFEGFPINYQNITISDSQSQSQQQSLISGAQPANEQRDELLVLHDNTLNLTDISSIFIKQVSADQLFAFGQQAGLQTTQMLKILSNVRFSVPLNGRSVLQYLYNDESARKWLESLDLSKIQYVPKLFQILESVEQNNLLGCCINGLLYILNEKNCNQQQIQALDYDEFGQNIEKIASFNLENIKFQEDQNLPLYYSIAHLYCLLICDQTECQAKTLYFSGRKYEGSNQVYKQNWSIKQKLQPQIKKILRQFQTFYCNQQNLAFLLKVAPATPLLLIIKENYPFINSGMAICSRTYDDGPSFINQILAFLQQPQNVALFPFEMVSIIYEFVQRLPWLYFDQNQNAHIFGENLLAELDRTKQLFGGFYQALKLQHCGIEINQVLYCSNQQFGDINYQKSIEDFNNLLIKQNMELEPLVDMALNQIFGAICIKQLSQLEPEESQTDANQLQINARQSSYQKPGNLETAEKLVWTGAILNQYQNQQQVVLLNKIIQSACQQFSDMNLPLKQRVRELQVVILLMKKYRVLLSNSVQSVSGVFQQDASLSNQFVFQIAKAIQNFSQDNQDYQHKLKQAQQLQQEIYNYQAQLQETVKKQQQQHNIDPKIVNDLNHKQSEISQLQSQHIELQNQITIKNSLIMRNCEEIKRSTSDPAKQQKQYAEIVMPCTNQVNMLKQQQQQVQNKYQQLYKECVSIGGQFFVERDQINRYNQQLFQQQRKYKELADDTRGCVTLLQLLKQLYMDELLQLDVLQDKQFLYNMITQLLIKQQILVVKGGGSAFLQLNLTTQIQEQKLLIYTTQVPEKIFNQLNLLQNQIVLSTAVSLGGNLKYKNLRAVSYYIVCERMLAGGDYDLRFQFLLGYFRNFYPDFSEKQLANYLIQNVILPLFYTIWPRLATIETAVQFGSLLTNSGDYQKFYEDQRKAYSVNKNLLLYQNEVDKCNKMITGELIADSSLMILRQKKERYEDMIDQLQKSSPVFPVTQAIDVKVPKTDLSLLQINFEKLAEVLGFLVVKRVDAPSDSEIDFVHLLINGLLSNSGLQLERICQFIRSFLCSLLESDYLLKRGGYIQIVMYHWLFILIILQTNPSDFAQYPFSILIANKAIIKNIQADYNIVFKVFQAQVQKNLDDQVVSQKFLASLQCFLNHELVLKVGEGSSICHRQVIQGVLELKRDVFNSYTDVILRFKELCSINSNVFYGNLLNCYNYYLSQIDELMGSIQTMYQGSQKTQITVLQAIAECKAGMLPLIKNESSQSQWLDVWLYSSIKAKIALE